MGKKDLQILDCTIRDGGLINDHQFDHHFVGQVYQAVSAAGVDYMEMGYRNSKKLFSSKDYGPWKFSDDETIRRVMDGKESPTKISVMVDVGRVEENDIKPKEESPVDMIRVATYVKNIAEAIPLGNAIAEKGYETTLNIMAISTNTIEELKETLHRIHEESRADVVYIVDSFGALYQETTEKLISTSKSILKEKKIGFHAHNQQQLAFANTLEAIRHGIDIADGTVFGIGRASGNCPLELLIGFLRQSRYDLRPILDLLSREFIPLREKIEWGYIIPYALTGMFNEHPRPAMALRNSSKKDDYRTFYESLVNPKL